MSAKNIKKFVHVINSSSDNLLTNTNLLKDSIEKWQDQNTSRENKYPDPEFINKTHDFVIQKPQKPFVNSTNCLQITKPKEQKLKFGNEVEFEVIISEEFAAYSNFVVTLTIPKTECIKKFKYPQHGKDKIVKYVEIKLNNTLNLPIYDKHTMNVWRDFYSYSEDTYSVTRIDNINIDGVPFVQYIPVSVGHEAFSFSHDEVTIDIPILFGNDKPIRSSLINKIDIKLCLENSKDFFDFSDGIPPSPDNSPNPVITSILQYKAIISPVIHNSFPKYEIYRIWTSNNFETDKNEFIKANLNLSGNIKRIFIAGRNSNSNLGWFQYGDSESVEFTFVAVDENNTVVGKTGIKNTLKFPFNNINFIMNAENYFDNDMKPSSLLSIFKPPLGFNYKNNGWITMAFSNDDTIDKYLTCANTGYISTESFGKKPFVFTAKKVVAANHLITYVTEQYLIVKKENNITSFTI